MTGNAQANVIDGNSLNNVLNGVAGNDTLTGNAGIDRLIGGTGRDTMTGGTENDVFDFNSKSDSGKTAATRDIITDFTHGADDIDLSTIDAKKGGGNQAFHFIGKQAFHHQAGELHFKYSGANTLVEGDTDGNGKADFQIELTGHLALTKGDFIL